jgi:broad specificity phosphatase PhoE
MTRLVLIRHGITEWNREGRYCGRKDVGLSRQGAAQAEKLGKKLKAVQFDKVYCSDRKRAVQTGRIVLKGAKITTVKALREIDFGVLEGLRHEEIMEKHADRYKKWLRDPHNNNIPGAEPVVVFKNRIENAIKRIVRLNPARTVAVVCHGGVIGIFLSGILRQKNFWRSVPSSASVTIVDYKRGKPRVKKFNDTTHLR